MRTDPGTSARLLVAVVPALLADVLCRALRHEGLDVVLHDTDQRHQPRRYTLAIVNGDLPTGMDAKVVISLPELPDPDLSGVLGVVRRSLAGYDAAGSEST